MPSFVKWLFEKLVNPLMKRLLRSPLHALVSQHLLLLTFVGRKSGHQYTTPVGYRRVGPTLYLFTESQWWKNFQTPAPVTLHLQGTVVAGMASAITDHRAIAEIILPEVQHRGAGYARRRYRLSLDPNRPPQLEDLLPALQNTTMIKVTLQ